MASLKYQKHRELLRKFAISYLPFLPLGIIVFIFLYVGRTGTTPGWNDWDLIGIVTVLTLAVRWLIGAAEEYLSKWLPWRKRTGWRLLITWALNSLIFIVFTGFTSLIALLFYDNFTIEWFAYLTIFREELIKLVVVGSSVMLLYSVIFFSFSSYNEYSKGEIEQIALKRKQLELQLNILRSQLSPHYLFNSLNTISSLIYKDPNLAEEFIRRLAGSYHYIISTNDKLSVSLRDEVDFVRSYHYLLKVRFENNINLEIDLDEGSMDSLIPPLTLQLLIENAVKHNAISSSTPLTISISHLPNGRIRVWNNRSGDAFENHGFRIGLENIRKRYKYLTQSRIEIRDSEDFEVTLPLIQSR